MNKKIFGLCDINESYTEAFSHFVSRHEGGRFDVRAFTKPESFCEYLQENFFDVLLISEDFMEISNKDITQIKGIPQNLTFILSETERGDLYGYPSIFRYQSSGKILAKVIKAYDKTDTFGSGKSPEKGGVYAIYSPIGHCGKTSLALALSEELSENGKALYVNLEEFCGHAELVKRPGYAGISDLIYKCEVDAENLLKDVDFHNRNGVSIVLSAGCPEDLRTASAENLKKVISILAHSFENVVLDISGNIKNISELLTFADKVFVPVPEDDISASKVILWEKESLIPGLSEKLIKITACDSVKAKEYAKMLLGKV